MTEKPKPGLLVPEIVLLIFGMIFVMILAFALVFHAEYTFTHQPTVSASLAIPAGAQLILVSSNGNERVIYRDGCYVTQEINTDRSGWQDISGNAYQCGPAASPSLP